MISTEKLINGPVLIIPFIIGAYLSGIFYLAENSAIPFTVFQITLILSFLFFFLKMLIQQNFELEVYGLEKWYLLFYLMIFFSIAYTPEREQALFSVVRFTVLLGMTYLIFNSIQSEGELRKICYAIIGVAVVLGVINIVQTYLNPEIAAFNYLNQGKKLIREAGSEADPNVFASNFIMPIMLLVAFFGYTKNRLLKFGLFAMIGILVGVVLLSYSRSSLLAVFLGICVILFYQRKYELIFYGAVAFLLLFISSEYVRTLTYSFGERILEIFSGSKDDSSKFRILLAYASVYMLFDTYFLGVGYQGFSTAFQKYYPPQETQWIYEPHNEFYAVYAELGLIGFTIFMAIIILIFKTAKQSVNRISGDSLLKPIALAFFASFLSYMVFFQFLGGMLHNSIYWICIALIFVVNKLVKSKPETDTNLIAESG